jgi:predicted permease
LVHAPNYYRLGEAGNEVRVAGEAVSWSYFQVLGLPAGRGRVFSAVDSAQRRDHLVVLSDRIWRTTFNARDDVVGTAIRVDGFQYEVVGVLPPFLTDPFDPWDLWFPVDARLALLAETDRCCVGAVIAGVTAADLPAVRYAVQRAVADWPQERPPTESQLPAELRSFRQALRESSAGLFLPLMFFVVIGISFVGGLNFGVLVLLSAVSRGRELAIRCALGASPRQVTARVVGESYVLVGFALLLGLAVSAWLIDGLRLAARTALPAWLALHVDARVVGTGVVSSALLGTLFALPPALLLRHANLQSLLKAGEAGVSIGRKTLRIAHALVFGELALTAVFLPLATLTGVQAFRASRLQVGFDYHDLVQVSVQSRPAAGSLNERYRIPVDLERLASGLPGVESATQGVVVRWPANGSIVALDDANHTGRPLDEDAAHIGFASGSLLRTLRVPILAGRYPTELETTTQAPVALLSESAATGLFGSLNVLGKSVRIDLLKRGRHSLTIIGLVPDVRTAVFGQSEEWPTVFTVIPGQDSLSGQLYLRVPHLQPHQLDAFRTQWRLVAPTTDITRIAVVESTLQNQLKQARDTFIVGLAVCTVFALLSLAGVFGVAAYDTRIRTREIGVRRALGAGSVSLASTLMRSLGVRAVLAATVGVPVGVAILNILSPGTYEVAKKEPIFVIAAFASIMVVVAVGAAGPVLRGLRIAPMQVLRDE